MATREEYLAGSLSQLKPWLAEGISRRQWERRRRALASPAVPAHKRLPQRQAEDLFLQRIHAYWDMQGMTHGDPQALSDALHAITLPEPLKHKDRRELGRLYKRARGRLPDDYDRWIGFIEEWDSSYPRLKARDLANRLVTAAGPHRYGILSKRFDYLNRQIT